jgi:choline-sulfatase
VTSDHGEEFNEHGVFQHRHLSEPAVRIPLLIHHPDAPGGGRTEVLFQNVDLLPTLAALLELRAPPVIDGRNLLRPAPAEDFVIGVAMTDPDYRALSLRKGQMKLVLEFHPLVGIKLFDLEADSQERPNVAWRHPDLVEAYTAQLWKILGRDGAEVVKFNRADPTAELDPRTVRALRALGYAQ